MTISFRNIALFALCLCFSGVTGISAFAQSVEDLQRENERLRAENEVLTQELQAMRERLEQTERELARLARALEAAGRSADLPSETVDDERGPGSVDESDPSSSPRALFAALQESYNEAVEDLAIGLSGDRERNIYLRALGQWRNRVNREFRAPIEWHVSVREALASPTGYTMQMVVVDPANMEQLGEPFEIAVPRAQARRYENLTARRVETLYVLRGALTPTVRINESRQSAGPFNNPPLIGRFAEFGFNLESRSLIPVEDEKGEG